MGCMGAPAKAFYPWLMDLPQLTPEARQFIEDEARRRLSAGTDAVGQAHAGLHHAMAANDPAALQTAASGLREGLQNIESGGACARCGKERLRVRLRSPGSAARPAWIPIMPRLTPDRSAGPGFI